MQIEAAVFRKPHAPLTIETVDIDAPTRREVPESTTRLGDRLRDRSAIDPLAMPIRRCQPVMRQ